MASQKQVTPAELAAHSEKKQPWLAINGQVYDFSEFAPKHPGGPEIIYKYAGRDASAEYNQIHSPSLVKKTLKKKHLGSIDAALLPKEDTTQSASIAVASTKFSLDDLLSLDDFERAGRQSFTRKAWAFVHGGANDSITLEANRAMLNRILLRPAILRKVGTVSTKTSVFGCDLAFPAFIAPMGTTMVAHEQGELAQAKAADKKGIVQCFSTAASYPTDDIIEATPKHAWFQLYINKDRAQTEQLVRKVTASGKVKAIFVTVDLPVVSKREEDERVAKQETVLQDGERYGVAKRVSSWLDPNLSWDDVKWLRGLTHLPIVIKGVQRYEDALLAVKYGCDGILISNHGGRAADGVPASILVLLEIRKRCPEVFGKLKVLIDGGFRRGSDIVKALCLGASAVGFGRPMMYAVHHDQPGVEHALAILRDEVETAMRLCGMVDIRRDPSLKYINTRDIDHFVAPAEDTTPLSKL